MLRIERKITQLKQSETYTKIKNVVGVDIPPATLDTNSIENDGTENFITELKNMLSPHQIRS